MKVRKATKILIFVITLIGIFCLAIFLLMFILSGCSTVQTKVVDSQQLNLQKQLLQPSQVVENYFKYYNEKNKEGGYNGVFNINFNYY
ncbi:MAG: hypothetical protein K0R54_4117 [Clostridiaceae bacterium]|jgi:uncharacterized protein YceK|nr:hypothetical protein [Clostridiaceae bacterium]